MDEDRIVLDRRSFEALAVDTRVRILKSLKQRRKTLSEIAKEQGMSVSGIKEHLETLEQVGLIEKIDDGHKWKYYELTKKGSGIVAPQELRVWILLSISLVAMIASLTAMYFPASAPQMESEALSAPQQKMMAAEAPQPAGGEAGAARDAGSNDASQEAGAPVAYSEPAPAEARPEAPDLAIPGAVGIVSALTLLACAGILVRNRLRGP